VVRYTRNLFWVFRVQGKRVETCEELKLNNRNIGGKFCEGIVGPKYVNILFLEFFHCEIDREIFIVIFPLSNKLLCVTLHLGWGIRMNLRDGPTRNTKKNLLHLVYLAFV
jgi:hypothetical protein